MGGPKSQGSGHRHAVRQGGHPCHGRPADRDGRGVKAAALLSRSPRRPTVHPPTRRIAAGRAARTGRHAPCACDTGAPGQRRVDSLLAPHPGAAPGRTPRTHARAIATDMRNQPRLLLLGMRRMKRALPRRGAPCPWGATARDLETRIAPDAAFPKSGGVRPVGRPWPRAHSGRRARPGPARIRRGPAPREALPRQSRCDGP